MHAEVWATDDIPADLPPMVEFKRHADEIIFDRYGIAVEHICAMRATERERERERELRSSDASIGNTGVEENRVKSTDSREQSELGVTVVSKQTPLTQFEKVTYEKMFYHIPKRKTGGAVRSRTTARIPCTDKSVVQQQSQNQLFTDFQYQSGEATGARVSNKGFSQSSVAQGARINTVQYLGIAADEPQRISRHTKPDYVLPLVDIGWDEAYCRQWCEENNLLSPIYTTASRGGCWFCHNQGVDQLRLLRKNYPDLWQLLLKWDKDSPTTFKSDGHTVHDFEKRFKAEDDGLITAGDRKFRWNQVLN